MKTLIPGMLGALWALGLFFGYSLQALAFEALVLLLMAATLRPAPKPRSARVRRP